METARHILWTETVGKDKPYESQEPSTCRNVDSGLSSVGAERTATDTSPQAPIGEPGHGDQMGSEHLRNMMEMDKQHMEAMKADVDKMKASLDQLKANVDKITSPLRRRAGKPT